MRLQRGVPNDGFTSLGWKSIFTLFAMILVAPGLLLSQTVEMPSPPRPEYPVSARSEATGVAQVKAALDVLGTVLEEHRKSGNRAGQAATLVAIAGSYNALGQRQRALEQFQLALGLYREIGDRNHEAGTLSQIGDLYRGWGYPEQSLPFYHDALAISLPTGNDAARAIALNNLGVAYLELRDKKKCFEFFNRALASYRAIENRRGEALTLNNLGMAYDTLSNNAQKSLESFQSALTKVQLIDDHDAQAIVLENLGGLFLKMGRKDMAALSFDHAIALFRREGDAQGEARILKHQAIMASDSARVSAAQSALAPH